MKARFFLTQKPVLRAATENDMKAMYEIWQQEHILPFMSFETLSLQEFKPIFDNFFTNNTLYVIEADNKVVAVRRLVYWGGQGAHCVSFCSFGVHKEHTGKGYGSMFYDNLIDMIKKNHPQIKRIELSQETDNPSVAGTLAEKKGFKPFATFGEWQPRLTGDPAYTNKWLVAEKFLELIIDPTLDSKRSPLFEPALPALKITNPLTFNIKITGPTNNCFIQDKLIASCIREDGVRRFDHIQFWSVKLEPDCDLLVAEQFLRELALESKKSFKKIELYSHDPDTIRLMKNLGFHCRGARTASCKIGENYYNETGAELSFYDINDAYKVLKLSKNNPDVELLNSVEACHKAIQEDWKNTRIDDYGQIYLENLVFQMVREVHSEALYEKETSPWINLISELPDNLDCKKPLEIIATHLNFNMSPKAVP